MKTNRTDFNETWLIETPMSLGKFPMYDTIEYSIKDRIKSGSKVEDLGNGLRKIKGSQIIYYWYESAGIILLGIELNIRPQGLVVSGLGKNPSVKGPPYASDLYDAVLKNENQSLRLISDADMSDDAFEIWKRLLTLGHTISVYDTSDPGTSFVSINNVDELKKYFRHDDTNYRKYRFVLSETNEVLAETRSYFNTRRMRELAGIPLEDYE
jgi:hypothetical protein